MSRLIVKNLPKRITEEQLRSLFSQKGTITDIQLKYTKEGVFRQFAFIGFQRDEEAEAAQKYFNDTCIQTSRIKVETCAALGAQEKPKAWSKYSKDSSTYKKEHGIDKLEQEQYEKEREERLKSKKKNHIDEIIGEHKNDPEFIEFLQVHDRNRNIWGNDVNANEKTTVTAPQENDREKKEPSKKTPIDIKKKPKVNPFKPEHNEAASTNKDKDDEESEVDEDDNEEDYDEEDSSDDEREDSAENSTQNKSANIAESQISDLEYMKQLQTKVQTKSKEKKKFVSLFTIKIKNLPYKIKREDIIKFFKPNKPFSVRIPVKIHGFCYVGFKTEKEFKKAMLKDKSFFKGKQVFLSDFTKQSSLHKDSQGDSTKEEKPSKWLKQEESLRNEEDISESGKIFFRNLAYTTTEDDLQKLFEKYGPVAEINLPIDPLTRQIKGFGTITYVMPEHAVQAFSELDGSLFHGRLLHLIPGKSQDSENDPNAEDAEGGLSFKKKKALKLKKSAGQSYNWNTLFMGTNAIADLLAKQFNTTKEKILDSETGGTSAAVRLALGETQIVIEMRRFLEENDVKLDAFNGESKKRSKTIILAKNLPAETTVAELRPLFSKYGLLGRIVLPPSGVTAIIEFLSPYEAKRAFQKLAYSKFKDLPLYLEWAPEDTFRTNAEVKKDDKVAQDSKEEEHKDKDLSSKSEITEDKKDIEENKVNNKEDEKKDDEENDDDDDDNEDPEPGTTIFLRNLNFKTVEETVREHFKRIGKIHMVQVARKKDPEDPQHRISLGYGFIQFRKKQSTEKALKDMQFTMIDGNQVELKRSDRTLKSEVKTTRKPSAATKQTGSKILVRNIPFQAKPNEIRDIFKAFGEIKSVRLPKKMTPGEDSHRGFGFVDFMNKKEAKKAFDTLCHSTHLFGRRLVLEWASVTDEDDVNAIRKRTAESFNPFSGDQYGKRSKKAMFDSSKIDNVKKDEEDDDV